MLQHAQSVGILLIGLTVTLNAYPASASDTDSKPVEYPGYELVWHDEFDVDGPPNPDNWSFEEGGFVRNREDQWYQADNAVCRDGYLVIEARRERRPNPNYDPDSDNWRENRLFAEYTSSLIHTRGKHEWTYGRFEIRGLRPDSAGNPMLYSGAATQEALAVAERFLARHLGR